MSPYSRRDALRLGLGTVGLTLAGCLAAPRNESGDQQRDPDATSERTATPEPKPTLLMDEVPPAEIAGDTSVALFSPMLRTWLERAIERGAIEVPPGAARNLSLKRAEFVRYDGSAYDLSVVQVKRESRYKLAMERASGTVRADAKIRSFESLTREEQAVVRDARRGEATIGFHEVYHGQYEFARRADFLEYEGTHYSLSVAQSKRAGTHTDLRIEPVENSEIGTGATVFDLRYVELPDEDRGAVEVAMRTGSATASEFSTPLETTVDSTEYVAGTGAIYTARIENPE